MATKIDVQKCSRLVIFFGIITILPLVAAAAKLFTGSWSVLGIYIVVMLVVPLIAWLIFFPKKATVQHYGKASKYLKFIMLSGIASLLLYYWLQYLHL